MMPPRPMTETWHSGYARRRLDLCRHHLHAMSKPLAAQAVIFLARPKRHLSILPQRCPHRRVIAGAVLAAREPVNARIYQPLRSAFV